MTKENAPILVPLDIVPSKDTRNIVAFHGKIYYITESQTSLKNIMNALDIGVSHQRRFIRSKIAKESELKSRSIVDVGSVVKMLNLYFNPPSTYVSNIWLRSTGTHRLCKSIAPLYFGEYRTRWYLAESLALGILHLYGEKEILSVIALCYGIYKEVIVDIALKYIKSANAKISKATFQKIMKAARIAHAGYMNAQYGEYRPYSELERVLRIEKILTDFYAKNERDGQSLKNTK